MLQLEYQDLIVDEGSRYQGGKANMSGCCYFDLTGHFIHIFAKVFNVLPVFVLEPRFLQGLDKHANGGRFDKFLILDDSTKYLGPEVVAP